MAKGSYKAPYKSGAKVGSGSGGTNRQVVKMASTNAKAVKPAINKQSKVC